MPARNEYNVTVPATSLELTKTYHGLSIINERGEIVGKVQSYNPVFAARAGSHVYELNAYTFGRPIDYVPGIESGRTLNCTRIEVWTDEMEVTFGPANDVARTGNAEWIDLCEQTRPFLFQEVIFKGNTQYKAWEYLGCWFKSKSLTAYGAQEIPSVQAQSEMAYVIRQPL